MKKHYININWIHKIAIILIIIFPIITQGQTILVDKGALWKYLDNGTNQGAAWKEVGFDDSGWASGNAELGYGDGGETTVISYGSDANNKYITYYFRHEFNVTNPDESLELKLEILRDDGAVVYINGKEVKRSNMPANAFIYYDTKASGEVSGSAEGTYYEYTISSAYLVSGTNLIAVEVHQYTNTSSDISFDLKLSTVPTSTGTVLVHQNSTWEYLDGGNNPPDDSWKQNNFTGSWASGAAELGYNDGSDDASDLDEGQVTTISYGSDASNKPITYYFRQEFTVNSIEAGELRLEILRDDGAVVYINGAEVARSNMPGGTITSTTTASGSVSHEFEDLYYKYLVPSTYLSTGTNTIAVEIHQSSKSSSDVSFNLKLSFTTESNFRKAPYLIYSGNNNEMMVLWQLKDTKNCSIAWGTDQNYTTGSASTTEYGTDHQHKYTITNLNNSTKYYFKVTVDDEIITGDFVTGPADNAQNITLIAYGDTRTYPSNHNSVAEQILNEYSANPSSQTILLLSGDLVADGDVETDWDDQFFDKDYTYIQKLFRSAPILSSTGNHEGNGTLFSKYFPYPFYASGDYYWSFDYGPVHIAIIDQYSDYTEGSTQYQWLEDDLSNTTKKWKIILLHEPGWSAYGTGGHSNNTDVQNYIQPLCEEYGVQFVIGGHNHYYARAFVSRVEHITTGGGGAPLYTPDASQPNIVKTDKSYHFIKLKIEGDLLYFTAINSSGTTIETFTYKRIYTWTGNTSSDWSEGGNWEMGVAPRSHSDVFIPAVSIRYPYLNNQKTKRKEDSNQ